MKQTTLKAEKADKKITVRNIKFNYDNIPRYWVLNSMIATHYFNSLHIIFPEGEKVFIDSVKYFENRIQSPELRNEIRKFCAQEGIHAREHERFWKVMEAQNLNPKGFEKIINNFFTTGKYSFVKLSDRLLNRIKPELGNKFLLSLTTALEHYTAIIGHSNFYEPVFSNDNMASEMLDLLLWHSAEEIEHKAVCFDALKEIDDSYTLRISGMIAASALLWSNIFIGQTYFIIQDKEKDITKLPKAIFDFVGNIATGEMGKEMSKNLLLYFNKNFHPDDIDDRHLAKKYFSKTTLA